MPTQRNVHNRGKISFSKYFQQFNEGDCVALAQERGTAKEFPKRMQGKTGIISGKRGRAYIVDVKDIGLAKQIIVRPLHLKKIYIKEQ